MRKVATSSGRPRETSYKSNRVRLPATNYGGYDRHSTDYSFCCECCNCSGVVFRKRLKTVVFYSVCLLFVFVSFHYTIVFGTSFKQMLDAFTVQQTGQSKHDATDVTTDRSSSTIGKENAEHKIVETSSLFSSTFHDSKSQKKYSESIEVLSNRLNVSQAELGEEYYNAVNKVKYLRFQDQMDIYWKSDLPLYRSKGVILMFHNCKYNGQEWWSLLRDDITFAHYNFHYSLPNEIRIASGFLSAGYWVVALTPVKNQYKNGCWVKDDRVFIPAIAEYLRALRQLSFQYAQKHHTRHGNIGQLLSSLTSSQHAPNQDTKLPASLSKVSMFAMGVTNGGAFMNQHLKYWMNPVSETPAPTHPQQSKQSPTTSSSSSSSSSKKSEEESTDKTDYAVSPINHHGFAGYNHANHHRIPINHNIPQRTRQYHFPKPPASSTNQHRRLTVTDYSASADVKPKGLFQHLAESAPVVLSYPPVQFDAIILMNAGIWHNEYYPPANAASNKNNKKSSNNKDSLESIAWALLPPVLFVDYTRNGDVVWQNAQTLQKLRALDTQRAEVLFHHSKAHHHRQLSSSSSSSASERKAVQPNVFAAQLLSEPVPLTPTFFSEHFSVLFPANHSLYPSHRVHLAAVPKAPTTSAAQSTHDHLFGAPLVSQPQDKTATASGSENSIHNDRTLTFTLPDTAVFTAEDSAKLFFALYVGDTLNRDDVLELWQAYHHRHKLHHSQYHDHNHHHQNQTAAELNTSVAVETDVFAAHRDISGETVWQKTVSELTAKYQRDGIERFIWPGSHILFKDVAGHIYLPRIVKMCRRALTDFFRDVDLLTESDKERQDAGLHSPMLQALRKAWAWRETNDEFITEMVDWFDDHRQHHE